MMRRKETEFGIASGLVNKLKKLGGKTNSPTFLTLKAHLRYN